jgi:hypothetical protein
MKSKMMTKREVRIEEAKLNPGVPAWRGKRRRELRVTGRGGRLLLLRACGAGETQGRQGGGQHYFLQHNSLPGGLT